MWSYYGSKSKIVDLYPPPKYNKIIEPFAGTGRYSLKYWENDILLIDKADIIINIWHYLQSCSKKDILKLPILKPGVDIRTVNLEEHEVNFMRFFIGQGMGEPIWKVTKRTSEKRQIALRNKIANNLYKIKHWKILKDDYKNINNEEAVWFIDPPYQFGGHKYIESNKNIDFKNLAAWSKSRLGQVIVCENNKASWMDFKPMVKINGSHAKSIECIWSNLETNYEYQQVSIF